MDARSVAAAATLLYTFDEGSYRYPENRGRYTSVATWSVGTHL